MTKDILQDEDWNLILRIAKKDIAAYRALIGKYLNKSVRFAERMTGDYTAAEDIMQEVSLKIWNDAVKLEPKAKFSTWLYQVLLNASIDHKRKKWGKSRVELDENIYDESAEPIEVIAKKREAETIRIAMENLPERQRAALVFSYYEGLKSDEAAGLMGINAMAFQQLLFRARQNLKQMLKLEPFEINKTEKNRIWKKIVS